MLLGEIMGNRHFHMMLSSWPTRVLVLTLFGLVFLGNWAIAAQSSVVKYSPGMQLNGLANRPDSDLVQFSDGRSMRLGDLRRLEQLRPRLRAGSAPKIPRQLQFQPAATGAPVRDAGDLAAALKRPDSDTVVLPSGRLATVGQIRFLQPMLEKKLGRSLTAAGSGKTIQVSKSTNRQQWQSIKNMPGDTVLVSPSGKRITVEALKEYLAIPRATSPVGSMPIKSAPVATPVAPRR